MNHSLMISFLIMELARRQLSIGMGVQGPLHRSPQGRNTKMPVVYLEIQQIRENSYKMIVNGGIQRGGMDRMERTASP